MIYSGSAYEIAIDWLRVGFSELVRVGVDPSSVWELLEDADLHGVDSLVHEVDVSEGLEMDHDFINRTDYHLIKLYTQSCYQYRVVSSGETLCGGK